MAAKNTKGKSNTKNTKNTKKPSPSAKGRRAQAPEPRRGLNPQIKAILLCAVGAVLLALVLIPGGNLWHDIRSFVFGIFGFCSILVPMVFF